MVVTYTIIEQLEEDFRGGERLRRTVEHLHFLSFHKKGAPMGLLHDIRMTGEVKASYDFQATGFTVEIVCKDVPEDVIMEEIERCQSVLQERLDFLHAPAQEHLDKLLDARGERA